MLYFLRLAQIDFLHNDSPAGEAIPVDSIESSRIDKIFQPSLDIKKAFDSINHGILLNKMKMRFGISSIELKWFKSYLSNREQQCSVNDQISSKKTITCGVPQGSILGPLLFLLYINDLSECLSSTTPCMYADDTQIFSSSYDANELVIKLNSDLAHVRNWLIENKLQMGR